MNSELIEYIKVSANGKSLNKISKEANISKSYLSYIINGKRKSPSPNILRKLAKALDVPYLELMEKAGYL